MKTELEKLLETGFVVERLLKESRVKDPTPRNLNLYFFVDKSIMRIYEQAKEFVFDLMNDSAYLTKSREDERAPYEGSDAEATLHRIQAYDGVIERLFPGGNHLHELHVRLHYYFPQEEYDFWMIAASVHFEPDNTHDNHYDKNPPYFGSCPLCGDINLISETKQDLHKYCRDDLGLELLIKGTIRGTQINSEMGKIRGVDNLDFSTRNCRVKTFIIDPQELEGADIDLKTIGSIIFYSRQSKR